MAVTHETTNVDHVTAEEVEEVEEVMAMVVDTTTIETTTREERMTTVRITMMTLKNKDQEVVGIEVEEVAIDQEVDLMARGEMAIIEEADIMALNLEMVETIKDREMIMVQDLEMIMVQDQEMVRISKNSQEMSTDITKVDIREREDTTMNNRDKDHAMMTGIEMDIKEAITIEDQEEEQEVTIEEEEEEHNHNDTTNDQIIIN